MEKTVSSSCMESHLANSVEGGHSRAPRAGAPGTNDRNQEDDEEGSESARPRGGRREDQEDDAPEDREVSEGQTRSVPYSPHVGRG